MMQLLWADRTWSVDFDTVWDCSTAIGPGGAESRAFGLPPSEAVAFEVEGFVGDTRRGGSVNCATFTVSPHGNGTHTECVGHIVDQRIAIADTLRAPMTPGVLVTVDLTALGDCGETYDAPHDAADTVLTAAALRAAIARLPLSTDALAQAVLAVRTRTPYDKRGRDWSGTNPPFLTREATELVVALGVRHLVLDVPSIDREQDAGLLANHHRFWQVPLGTRDVALAGRSEATLTEMMVAPPEMADGMYLFSLQVPPLRLDAAPSRVLASALSQPKNP